MRDGTEFVLFPGLTDVFAHRNHLFPVRTPTIKARRLVNIEPRILLAMNIIDLVGVLTWEWQILGLSPIIVYLVRISHPASGLELTAGAAAHFDFPLPPEPARLHQRRRLRRGRQPGTAFHPRICSAGRVW